VARGAAALARSCGVRDLWVGAQDLAQEGSGGARPGFSNQWELASWASEPHSLAARPGGGTGVGTSGRGGAALVVRGKG